MEKHEFRQILELFPIVRSRNYRADSESSTQATSRSIQNEQVDDWQDAWDSESNKDIDIKGIEEHDGFWEKLRSAAAKKVSSIMSMHCCVMATCFAEWVSNTKILLLHYLYDWSCPVFLYKI
ncbi:uncharacterized protein LOC135149732 isoform X3 [Daucus carota subsp. sativus]|uniref:uncharacterized protein LOC108202661 isoform X3 n=1 Tax=Daucus carota subsp. sativus TaxID=79200 RepID=UPI0007EF2350|nr:PREDICTED: uncharacterized protein LOC108200838 [Daucus carota subsp. sativus]